MTDRPWLVVIDPQRIFADAPSPWGSPMFARAVEPIHRLAAAYRDRVVVTRFVAPAKPRGSWAPYMRAWPFADVSAEDPLYDVVEPLSGIGSHTVTATTFGKWGPELEGITGAVPRLVVVGVATDCCVISTVLAAADAGATIEIAADACAGSTPENHAKALDIMALYAPQVTVRSTGEILADRGRATGF